MSCDWSKSRRISFATDSHNRACSENWYVFPHMRRLSGNCKSDINFVANEEVRKGGRIAKLQLKFVARNRSIREIETFIHIEIENYWYVSFVGEGRK